MTDLNGGDWAPVQADGSSARSRGSEVPASEVERVEPDASEAVEAVDGSREALACASEYGAQRVRSNAAIPVGGVLILVSFFLPWISLGSGSPSGFDLAFKDEAAKGLLVHFGVDFEAPALKAPTRVTRPLVLLPLMALGVLLLDVTAGSRFIRRPTRRISRLVVLATGVFFSIVFGYLGCGFPTLRLGPAFWTTFSGGLLIAVGSVFDVLRGS